MAAPKKPLTFPQPHFLANGTVTKLGFKQMLGFSYLSRNQFNYFYV